MPVLLTLILIVVQTALAWHAKTMVDAAASDALIAAQVDGGTEQAGKAAADNLLRSSSSQLLTDVQITIRRSPSTTDVRVEARVVNVVPLLPIRVHSTASGSTERFRSDREVGP